MIITKIAQNRQVPIRVKIETIVTEEGTTHKTLTHGLGSACQQALEKLNSDGTGKIGHTDEFFEADPTKNTPAVQHLTQEEQDRALAG